MRNIYYILFKRSNGTEYGFLDYFSTESDAHTFAKNRLHYGSLVSYKVL